MGPQHALRRSRTCASRTALDQACAGGVLSQPWREAVSERVTSHAQKYLLIFPSKAAPGRSVAQGWLGLKNGVART